MTKAALTIIISLMLVTAVAVEPMAQDGGVDDTDRIERAITYLMRKTPRSKRRLTQSREARQELAQEMMQVDVEFPVDPFLLISIFFTESSLNPKAESGNTRGMGQVGPQGRTHCARNSIGYETRLDQMRCTAFIIAGYESKCETIYGALIAYVGWGECTTESKKKHWQVKRKLRLAAKLRRVTE